MYASSKYNRSSPVNQIEVCFFALGLTQNDQILPIFTGFGAVRNRTYRGVRKSYADQSRDLQRHQTVSFPNEHFAGCGEVAGVNRVEIDTAAHGFSHLITAIPIDGLCL